VISLVPRPLRKFEGGLGMRLA